MLVCPHTGKQLNRGGTGSENFDASLQRKLVVVVRTAPLPTINSIKLPHPACRKDHALVRASATIGWQAVGVAEIAKYAPDLHTFRLRIAEVKKVP